MSGQQITLDYAGRTSCEAYVADGLSLLIVGYGNDDSGLVTDKCSVFATGSLLVEGKIYEPSDEIKSFLNDLRDGSVGGAHK